MVLSGINRGANLGSDVHYSGTVAAAREAALKGVPAIASSLHITDWDPESTFHYDTAAQVTVEVARSLLADPLPPGVFLNVNVPDLPRAEIKGLRPAPIGEHLYEARVAEGRDPRGKPYYWIGGPALGFAGGAHTDGELLEAGYAAVSPMRLDPTAHDALAQLQRWIPTKH
ncbi:MAG: 5'-nucleotidase [Myxococcota bacterium]